MPIRRVLSHSEAIGDTGDTASKFVGGYRRREGEEGSTWRIRMERCCRTLRCKTCFACAGGGQNIISMALSGLPTAYQARSPDPLRQPRAFNVQAFKVGEDVSPSVIDNRMRRFSFSITAASLFPPSIQLCLPPGSCLVREFPHLVASEFQDISFLTLSWL